MTYRGEISCRIKLRGPVINPYSQIAVCHGICTFAVNLTLLYVQGSTVVSRYYDSAGIRKKYHNIQTIEISSINI